MKPLRTARRLAKAIEQRFAEPCGVLMYHNIAEVTVDPWDLCVTPTHFAEQLEVLARCCDVVPLNELRQSLTKSRAKRPLVAITFDDGYAQNLLAAKPLLERAGLPATVFITTGQLDCDREFWWDELEQLLLHEEPLPMQIEIEIDGRATTWDLQDRSAAYLALWHVLQPLAPEQQTAALDALGAVLGRPAKRRDSHRSLTAKELRDLADGGLVQIGAHTVNHPRLTRCPAETRQQEVVESKSRLEALLDRPVTAFAYPFGDHDRNAVRVAADAGFSIACTTEERLVTRRDDPLAIPRFAVGNWGGEAFNAWMLDRRLVGKANCKAQSRATSRRSPGS